MTKIQHWHLKNDMLSANLLANLIAVTFFQMLMFRAEPEPPEYVWQIPVIDFIDIIFTPGAFIFVTVMTLIYERPIRSYLNSRYDGKTTTKEMENIARRKILNEPFVAIGLDLSMWVLSAVVYGGIFWLYDIGSFWIQRSFFVSLSTGLITVTLAFFLMEHVLQKRLAPHIFPEGGLYSISKTLRIRIRTRLVALFFGCNLVPLFSILHIIQRITSTNDDPLTTIDILRALIITNSLIFIGTGVCLTMLVNRNLTLPFGEIIQSLRGVRKGNFDKKVQVTTNDEIGYTGDVINEMTEGLKERDRMRQSLGLAMDVQQHLLPQSDPKIEGLDIAGKSIYCEETGGDYYDYLGFEKNGRGKIKVVVGDVSDHGIPSALLMTTARAFLRQRASKPGKINQIVADVNRQISRDVEESGQFMTLFFCEIDGHKKFIRWVNAGHDPAIIYDPINNDFDELAGHALPLGVSEKAAYQEYQYKIQPGQIILIGTDGIWESQNAQHQMFGKKRFKDYIRAHAQESAKDILHSVIARLDEFRYPLEKEDDVTLVVIKVEACRCLSNTQGNAS
ncbi:MAG: SpoIIE family protein phosphatase [Deltaproteobacteria bacterium]|nr:SpoIIE family protein phosphatase [Deltaproteobacteria bacterium]